MRLLAVLGLALLAACTTPSGDCEADNESCVSSNPGSASAGQSSDGSASDGSASDGQSSDSSSGEMTSACSSPPPNTTITPKDPAPKCVPGVPCVDDANCPDGHVCNYAFDEPACELLFCGGAGTPCVDDSVCESGLLCHEGLCNPCDFCGDRCAIDFSTDPDHCGCCDRPTPQGGACEDGTPTCPDGQTICGDVCADLAIDPDHCGACDNPVPGCVGGEPGCAEDGEIICGDTCINAWGDDANCGACGAQCPNGVPCKYPGYCFVQSDVANSCNTVCGQQGLICTEESMEWTSAQFDGWCGWTEETLATCKSGPKPSVTCGSNPSCTCALDLDCACAIP